MLAHLINLEVVILPVWSSWWWSQPVTNSKDQLISRNITMCQYLRRSVKICKDLHRSVKIFQCLLEYVKICRDLTRSAKICQDLSRSAKICQDLSRSIGICEDLERSDKICWDLSKYILHIYMQWTNILMILKSYSPFVLRLMPQRSNGRWQWRCLSVRRQRES